VCFEDVRLHHSWTGKKGSYIDISESRRVWNNISKGEHHSRIPLIFERSILVDMKSLPKLHSPKTKEAELEKKSNSKTRPSERI